MRRGWAIAAVVLFFAAVNAGMYVTVTRRLANNFSSTRQMKMVDVAQFLPFEPESALARTESSFCFDEDDTLPVLDGAAALVPVYASVIDACYPAGSVTYEGGVFSDDNYYGENFAPDSVMQYHNTIRGFDALVAGDVDLFFTARPSAAQMQAAEDEGVALTLVPIGTEAFVFFVNTKNPVDGLTSEQIRAIYRGQITHWQDVGGANRRIDPLTRVEGSGSQTMMEHIMEDDMRMTRDPLAVFGGGIGYSFRWYLSGMVADERVKMLAVDGVYPDAASIREGRYPFVTPFYVAYRTDDATPETLALVDWLLSAEGQDLIEACGYVGLPDGDDAP